MNGTLIAKRTERGAYDMLSDQMIIDTEEHGRLLVCDGFGGTDMRGECYRWEYGTVAKLQPGDTFADLDEWINDSGTTLFACVTTGNDQDRPLLRWPGTVIMAIAKKYWGSDNG